MRFVKRQTYLAPGCPMCGYALTKRHKQHLTPKDCEDYLERRERALKAAEARMETEVIPGPPRMLDQRLAEGFLMESLNADDYWGDRRETREIVQGGW